VYYKCVKLHKNPISHLGGVALTRYMPLHPKNLTHKSPKEHVDQVSANILNIAGRISNYTLGNRKRHCAIKMN
jgi:hypothetical protein